MTAPYIAAPASVSAPVVTATAWIKRLLYAYFILWVIEGALRKWALPQLSDALLLLRDPLLLLIYGIAAANGVFPRNRTLFVAALLCVLSAFVGFLVLPEAPAVILYGVRTNFLFLPLVYLIPKVWNRNDVERLGNLALLMSLPMAALMLAQFLADPTAFINVGAGGGVGGQISTARGHIRPAGTFSFITGPNCFFALTAAFALNGLLSSAKFRPRPWLTTSALVALIVATVTSGSRSQLVAVGCVMAVGACVAAILNQRLFVRLVGAAAILSVASLGVAQFSFFAEGASTLTERLQSGQGTISEGVGSGIVVRTLNGFTNALDRWSEAPPFGQGLGVGTTVGGKFLTGKQGWVIDAEEEWSRIVLESGPLLGGAYLLVRTFLVLSSFAVAIPASRRFKNALPALLAAAAGPQVLTGQWGQTSVLGYAVFAAGLAFAAAREPGLVATASAGGAERLTDAQVSWQRVPPPGGSTSPPSLDRPGRRSNVRQLDV